MAFDESLFDESLFNDSPTTTSGDWTLGALWTITSFCAKQGMYGLGREADGITGDSDVVNNTPINVDPGQTLFTSFWLKGTVGADGTISFGFSFYDADGAFLSSIFIDSTGFPVYWTQFDGNITVPAFAATAVPTIRATNHLTGIWCVDNVLAVTSGGHFVLSSLKHYYSPYSAFR